MKKLMFLATALLAGTALAQTAPVAPPAPAPTVHAMQDKVMTRAEAVAMVRDHFARMDADRNGAISTAEVEQMRTKVDGDMKAQRFEHRLDGPGRDPNAAFDRLDANKDGSISREEFAKGRELRMERRVVTKDGAAPKDGKGARRQSRMHRMGGMGGGRMIAMADTNKDGQITLAEAETLALQHFDQMDANRDGQVTREERRAGRPMIIKRTEQKKSGS